MEWSCASLHAFLSWANCHPLDQSLCEYPCNRRWWGVENQTTKVRAERHQVGVRRPNGRPPLEWLQSLSSSHTRLLGMSGPRLWSFASIGDRLIWVWVLFLHTAGPWFGLVVDFLLLGSFCFAYYCVTLCFFVHFECIFHVFHECLPANDQTPKLVEIVSSKP